MKMDKEKEIIDTAVRLGFEYNTPGTRPEAALQVSLS